MNKMTDIREATKLIREMLPIIDPEEDFLTIVAAEQKIAASEAKRKKAIEEAFNNLKGKPLSMHTIPLSRTLEAARVSSTRPASVPSEEAHSRTLHELDKERLNLAKSISDLEGTIASKEAELGQLKDEVRKLELYDPAAEHEKELDGSVLKLAFYKGMGFEPVVGKDGQISKMLVRSQSGDVHIVDFTSGLSQFEYTQLLWKLASE